MWLPCLVLGGTSVSESLLSEELESLLLSDSEELLLLLILDGPPTSMLTSCFSAWGFLAFFRKHDVTYRSSSRNVEGFKVSKSISISSGFEFLSEGSRD